MRTAMAPIICARSASPALRAFRRPAFAQELEDAGDGAIAAQSIDEIVSYLGSDFRRKLTR